MSDVKLTAQQAAAVNDRGGELLVSAAAGSGKTKVLVERLFSYMEQGANVDDFLIITYTKAAASELRGKIASELARRVAENPTEEHLRRQLFRVYQADIKTVDAFCVGILRQNTHLLDPVNEKTLTPDFCVLDEQEALLLRQRVLERTLDAFYEQMDDGKVQLCETLGAGRDDARLTQIVLELHEKLQSHAYPLRWLEEIRERWRHIPEELTETAYGKIIVESTVRKAVFWAEQLEKATELCQCDEKLMQGYADRFAEAAQQLRQYCAAAEEGWEAMAAIVPTFRTMGRAPDSPEKLQLQAILKRCKEAIKELRAPFAVPQEKHIEDLKAMAPVMTALIDLTADFCANYQEEKVRRNVMDFSDQEHYAVTLLQRGGHPTELSAQLSGRYREVMVDEYQDSNAVQEFIYDAVSDGGKKLFCVGDVKQSIYRFRLADPTIFLAKYLAFPDADAAQEGQPRRVCLIKNFRSRESVLDAANFVMAAIMSPEMGEMEYARQERLYFGGEYYLPRSDAATEFHLVAVEDTEEQQFDRQAVEADFVAARVHQLLEEGYPVQEGEGFRPCRPEDIVILLRSPRARLKALTTALERQGVPCASGEKSGFFDTVEIAIVYSLLQIIDNPRQDVPLISVLRSPLFGFTADKLAEIRALRRDGDFYDALSADESEMTAAFLEALHALRRWAGEQPVDALLWRVYTTLHILPVFSAMPEGEERRRNLLALYDYARECTAAGVKSLFDFVTRLRQMMEKQQVPAVSTHTGGSGVQIMSIHKSKGLEFPIVILCDLNKRFDSRDRQNPVLVHQTLGLGTERVEPERRIRYDTISKTAVAMQLAREAKSEEMRILYVAMTRAKEKLILIDCMKNAQKRIRDMAALASVPAAPEAVASARALGDWLLLPLLATPDAGEICAWAQTSPQSLTPIEGSWQIRFWLNPQGCAHTPQEISEQREADAPADLSALSWEYPHRRASMTPTKVTATQLKGREIDREIAVETEQQSHETAFQVPKFLQERRGLSAAQRGTAMHLVMQYLDFSTPGNASAVQEQVDALQVRRLLTPQEAQAIDCPAVARFLASPLCDRMRAARQVYREYRFSLLTDAALYDRSLNGEEIFLQGVVDCAFVEDGQLVIVDFKTDRIREADLPRRSEVYRPQVEAYSLAMEKVLSMPVREKILYFFATDTAVSL